MRVLPGRQGLNDEVFDWQDQNQQQVTTVGAAN
jgi:hypothetical protein